MPGGYPARSGGDELGFLLHSAWVPVCGTGTFALLPLSWETDIPMELTCAMNGWSALAEQELRGHPSCGTDVLWLPRPLQPLRSGSWSTLVIPLLRDKI